MTFTAEQVRELLGGASGNAAPGHAVDGAHPYHVGQPYMIRTVTHYYTGRLIGVYEHELVIEDAAWIADTGRFSEAMQKGAIREAEPFSDGPVVIGRGAIIDAAIYPHQLTREVIE